MSFLCLELVNQYCDENPILIPALYCTAKHLSPWYFNVWNRLKLCRHIWVWWWWVWCLCYFCCMLVTNVDIFSVILCSKLWPPCMPTFWSYLVWFFLSPLSGVRKIRDMRRYSTSSSSLAASSSSSLFTWTSSTPSKSSSWSQSVYIPPYTGPGWWWRITGRREAC